MAKPESDCAIEKDPDNLVQLRDLTGKLRNFAEVLRPFKTPEIKEFNLESGTSYMVGLYKAPAMAVSRVYSAGGVEFPEHAHNEWELVVVYQGELHLTVGGEKKILAEKEFFYILPGVPHRGYYPVDSWILAITMPASEDFPEGG